MVFEEVVQAVRVNGDDGPDGSKLYVIKNTIFLRGDMWIYEELESSVVIFIRLTSNRWHLNDLLLWPTLCMVNRLYMIIANLFCVLNAFYVRPRH